MLVSINDVPDLDFLHGEAALTFSAQRMAPGRVSLHQVMILYGVSQEGAKPRIRVVQGPSPNCEGLTSEAYRKLWRELEGLVRISRRQRNVRVNAYQLGVNVSYVTLLPVKAHVRESEADRALDGLDEHETDVQLFPHLLEFLKVEVF